MKKTILLLSVLLLTACSVDDNVSADCNCERNVFEQVTTTIWTNGMPHLSFSYDFKYSELVECQEPNNDWQNLGHDNLVYKISCD